MNLRKLRRASLAAAILLVLWSGPAHGFPIGLSDLNSTLLLNTTFGSVNWTVDGIDNLFYESFNYRFGNGSVRELTNGFNVPAGCIASCGVTYNLTDGATTYGTGRLTHTLFGGAPNSHRSGWTTSFDFVKLINDAPSLFFYAYADYDLNATPNNDTVVHLGNGDFVQWDDEWNLSWDTSFPSPAHCTARAFSGAGGAPGETSGDLNDSCNFSGNPIFMAQWNDPWNNWSPTQAEVRGSRSLAPVPSPSSLLLLGIGLLGLGGSVRRKQSS